MGEVIHRERLAPAERNTVARLLEAERAGGSPNRLEPERWESLVTRGAAGFGAWLVSVDDGPTAYVHARPVGDPPEWELAMVTGDRSGESLTVARPALAAGLDHVAGNGGGPVELWVSASTPAYDRVLGDLGLHAYRSVLQLRRPLPVDEPWSVDVRPFRPGQDEQRWLAVNNRAFAWHPEQGGWTLEDLRQRMSETWFDPAGFLLHERDSRLAGFCWTKVHRDTAPPMGEIYVIAVDPDFGGRGLGRELTLAGLSRLSEQELAVGMLYVDSDNEPARRLYERMGFTIDHADRAYSTTVDPE